MEQEIVFEKLKQIISEVFSIRPEDITMETTFVKEFGADSMDFLQILIKIEDEFDMDITTEEIKSIETVADIVKKITNIY